MSAIIYISIFIYTVVCFALHFQAGVLKFHDMSVRIVTCCRLVGASCTEENYRVQLSLFRLEFLSKIFTICGGNYNSSSLVYHWQMEKERITSLIDKLVKADLFVEASERMIAFYIETEHKISNDKDDMRRLHGLGGRIMNICELTNNSWKEMEVMINYLKSGKSYH